MSNFPFVLRTTRPSAETAETPGRDVPATEDFLPSALESDASGYVSARATRITEVNRETTDDN
jgi:hypothetical protein